MKAIYLFMCLLFVSGPALKAQYERITIKTWKDYNLKGRVKYVMEDTLKILTFTPEGYLSYRKDLGRYYTYDKMGYLLTEEDVITKFTTKYTHNTQGVLMKKEYIEEGKHTTTILYDMYGNIQKIMFANDDFSFFLYKNTYDAQKRIIHIERFKSLKKLSDIQFIYLPNGWMRYVETYTDNGDKAVTELDNKGRKRFISTKTRETTYTYDDNGNLVEHKERWGYSIYAYNAQGEDVSCTYISKSGEKSKEEYVYFKHDAMGNWTEKVTDSGGEKTTTKRILSYYD